MHCWGKTISNTDKMLLHAIHSLLQAASVEVINSPNLCCKKYMETSKKILSMDTVITALCSVRLYGCSFDAVPRSTPQASPAGHRRQDCSGAVQKYLLVLQTSLGLRTGKKNL